MRKLIVSLMVIGLAISFQFKALASGRGSKQNSQEKSASFEGKDKQEKFTELGLSQEQQEKVKQARKNHREKAQTLRQSLKAKHNQLKSILEDPASSPASAKAVTAEINKVQAELLGLRVESVFALKEVLSPKQHQKLKAMHKQRRARMKEGVKNKGHLRRQKSEEPN